ncbi:hypothetical protein D3C84_948230 [compost metagenome]
MGLAGWLKLRRKLSPTMPSAPTAAISRPMRLRNKVLLMATETISKLPMALATPPAA